MKAGVTVVGFSVWWLLPVVGCFLAASTRMSVAACAWCGVILLCSITLAGCHMVWTHFWLITTGMLYFTGNPTALATATAVGILINVPWYFLLLFHGVRENCAGKAWVGWSTWILSWFGCPPAWKNEQECPVFAYIGFHVVDLGVHLCPSLVLTQLFADDITLTTVVVAYCIARIWMLCITVRHLSLDWPLLTHRGRIAFGPVVSQDPTCFPTEGVINDVYGFVPHMPSSVFRFGFLAEGATVLAMAAITQASDSAAIFRFFGASHLVDPIGLYWLIGAFCALGFPFIFVAAFLSNNAAMSPHSSPANTPQKGSPISTAVQGSQGSRYRGTGSQLRGFWIETGPGSERRS